MSVANGSFENTIGDKVIRIRQRGQGMVEVSVVVALVAIAAIVAMSVMGTTMSQVFSNVVCDVQGANPSVFPSSVCVPASVSPGVSPSASGTPSVTPSGTPTGSPSVLPLTGGRFVYVLNAPAAPDTTPPDYAYVSPANGTLTRIDAAGVQTNLAVGRAPIAMAITPDGSKIYVLNRGDNYQGGPFCYPSCSAANSATVQVVRTSDFTTVSTVPVRTLAGDVDGYAYAIATSNTNTYVTSGLGCLSCPGGQGDGWSVMAINHASLAVSHISWNDSIGSSPTETLNSIAITADGNTGYVVDSDNHDVTKLSNLNSTPSVDTSDPTQQQVVPAGDYPYAIPYDIALNAGVGYISDYWFGISHGDTHGGVWSFNLSSLAFGAETDLGIVGPQEIVATNSNVYAVVPSMNDIGYNAIPLDGVTNGSTIAIPTSGYCAVAIGVNQLAYDAADGIIWEASCADAAVIAVDAPTNTVVGTPISVPDRAVAVVVG